jgi:polar amino acid transport system ATP-binding protein
MCFFHAGRIEEECPAQSLFENPQNERTQQCLRAVMEAI